jgi:hypothetical protein
MFYELTRWWAYRSIKGQGFAAYLWLAPAVVAAPLCVIAWLLQGRFVLVGAEGLFAVFSQALSVLPGFFIASLSAVASLSNDKMDQDMPPPCPQITIQVGGRPVTESLTRRMYLSYLFSYLFVVTLVFAVVSTGFRYLVGPEDISQFACSIGLNSTVRDLIRGVATALTIFCVSSVLVTMLHGLYFVVERNRQPT